ncbi:MAG: ribose-phosphate diphosphokinase [Erythrobacter sp.]
MTAALIHYFDDSAGPARQLAEMLGTEAALVEVHRFPDGESLVRVAETGTTALLYRSLDNPNAKLVELLLAAAALRDRGANEVILVAPYLGYMRQDIAFRAGEAVSQRVIGRLLAGTFDGVLTIDPHLHRIATLGEAIPSIPAIAISATPALAQALDRASQPVLAGPDSESRQWVSEVAGLAGLPFIVGDKQRRGDRDVDVFFAQASMAAGRPVVLVDDLISSGRTLIEAAYALHAAGAARVDAVATHCLASEADLAAMRESGIGSISATNSVAGPSGKIPVASLLEAAIRENRWAVEALK